MEEPDEDFTDDEGLLDCPKCGAEYDEIDQDFYICSKCGFNANTKTTDRRKILRDPNQLEL